MQRRKPCQMQASLLLLALLTFRHVCLAVRDRELIGWSERLQRVQDTTGSKLGELKSSSLSPTGAKLATRLEVISWEPRIFLLHDALSEEECEYLIQKASPIIDKNEAGRGTVEDSASDTSQGSSTSFKRGEDRFIENIERRLSEHTMIPPGNGQGMQVLRYSQGQGYKPHFDYFFNKDGISNGGNRLATVLMFLESAEEGGETVFPNLPRPPTQTLANGWSECSMQGHAIKPKRGDAIVFWSLKTDGTLDPGTLHGTCPTSTSSANPLWTSTKWFNVGHYVEEGSTEKAVEVQHVIYAPPPPPAPPGCMDTNESCAGWASVGECDKNPGFMVGSKQSPGACLLSCAHCDFMPLHSPDAGKSPIAITKNNGTHEQQQHQEEGAP